MWSPDSSQVIYGILSGGRPASFMRANSDGSGAEERLQLPICRVTLLKRGPPSRRMATVSPSTYR